MQTALDGREALAVSAELDERIRGEPERGEVIRLELGAQRCQTQSFGEAMPRIGERSKRIDRLDVRRSDRKCTGRCLVRFGIPAGIAGFANTVERGRGKRCVGPIRLRVGANRVLRGDNDLRRRLRA